MTVGPGAGTLAVTVARGAGTLIVTVAWGLAEPVWVGALNKNHMSAAKRITQIASASAIRSLALRERGRPRQRKIHQIHFLRLRAAEGGGSGAEVAIYLASRKITRAARIGRT